MLINKYKQRKSFNFEKAQKMRNVGMLMRIPQPCRQDADFTGFGVRDIDGMIKTLMRLPIKSLHVKYWLKHT